jgi:hypothetical protein
MSKWREERYFTISPSRSSLFDIGQIVRAERLLIPNILLSLQLVNLGLLSKNTFPITTLSDPRTFNKIARTNSRNSQCRELGLTIRIPMNGLVKLYSVGHGPCYSTILHWPQEARLNIRPCSGLFCCFD